MKTKSKPNKRRHLLDRHADQLADQPPAGIGHNQGPPLDDDTLLTTTELAVWLKVSMVWLEIGRIKNYGPEYVQLAPRCIRYRVGAVKKWLKKRSHAHTAEYDTKGHRGPGRPPRAKAVA